MAHSLIINKQLKIETKKLMTIKGVKKLDTILIAKVEHHNDFIMQILNSLIRNTTVFKTEKNNDFYLKFDLIIYQKILKRQKTQKVVDRQKFSASFY